MDQSEKEKQPSIDLPPVHTPALESPVEQKQGDEAQFEKAAESQSQPTHQPPLNTANHTVNTTTVPTPQMSSPPTSSPGTPMIADDVDLIEKEWVVKAKEIVEKTKDDPYLQNKAISEFKADYIKKRYNKDVTANG